MKKGTKMFIRILVLYLTIIIILPAGVIDAGEKIYDQLLDITRGEGDKELFAILNNTGRELDWSRAQEEKFIGDLRHLTIEGAHGNADETCLYLIRTLEEDIYVLSVTDPDEQKIKGTTGHYDNLQNIAGNRSNFHVLLLNEQVNGEFFTFARLQERSERILLDRIFEVCCTLMLFLIMVGMGLTLQMKDFGEVLKKPRAMFTGAFLQWVIMPLIAVGIARLFGYHEHYPYIYIGIVLISVSPGGTSSNIMTYFAKGDLALSISLTSFSTVLSLLFTPLLLILYCGNVSDVPIPAVLIVQIIIALVIIPLALGMLIRSKWPVFAENAVPYFSRLGIAALIIIISTGIITNLEKFADTERYGLQEYILIMFLTFMGIALGIIIPKLLGINNFQTRAISMENGLRNSILAMTIAVLLQDIVGDFHSSMFAVAAVFGIGMYFSGFAAIYLFKRVLPLDDPPVDDQVKAGAA